MSDGQKKQKGGGLFGAINDLKNNDEPEEDQDEKERAKFRDDTLCGRIARTKTFEWSTLGVIVFNALYLGYDCDYNARWGKPEDLYKSTLYGFMIWDNLFCLFFTGELVIRAVGYKVKKQIWADKPFLFDLFLVTMMVFETWVLAFLGPIDALKQVSILRLLRLTRLFRMAKLMNYFPELKLIVKGMLAAVRSVGCASILLVLCLYVFAIIFTNEYHQGLKADDDEDIEDIELLFGSMGKSMRHLLIMATILDDITACTNAIRSTGNMFMLMAFFMCVLVSSFTLFNMLLGILCEVVEATEQGEKEKEEQQKLSDTIMGFFKTMDLDGNGIICRNEFLKMAQHQDTMVALEKLDIDEMQFSKYAELLFTPNEDGGPLPTLNYEEAVNMIMRLRPGQSVNACDFEYFRNMILKGNADTDRYLTDLELLLEEAAGVNEEEEEEEDAPSPCSNKDYELLPYGEIEEISPVSNDQRRPSKNSEQLAISTDFKASSRKTLGAAWAPPKPIPRQTPTIRSLAAEKRHTTVATVPPVNSRWSVQPDEAPLSPQIPESRIGGSNEAVVAERLHVLAQKRATLSANLRTSMGHVTPNAMMNGPIANYHMTQYSNLRNSASWTNENDDNRPPFAPQF